MKRFLLALLLVATSAQAQWPGYSFRPAGGGSSSTAVGDITGLGTGVATALAVNIGSAGAPVVNGGALGTPSSGTLTNATGLPAAGVVGTAAILGANTFTANQIVGSGTTTAVGVRYGYSGTSGFGGIWQSSATPGTDNGLFFENAGATSYLRGTTAVKLGVSSNFFNVTNGSGAGSILIGNSVTFGWTNAATADGTLDLFLSRPAAATLQLGAADADTNALIVAQTLRTQGLSSGGTSNQAGKDFTVIVSPGKGTGAGGSFIVQTTPPGSTGTTVGTPTTAFTVGPRGLTTIHGGSVGFTFNPYTASTPTISATGGATAAFTTGVKVTQHIAIETSGYGITYATAGGNAVWQLGVADVAGAPVAQILRAQSASGVSNTAGADWKLQASAGTGSAAGGAFIVQVAPAAGSSSTKNAYVDALKISTTALTLSTVVAAASSGTRYLCIDTAGVVTSSASACSGT